MQKRLLLILFFILLVSCTPIEEQNESKNKVRIEVDEHINEEAIIKDKEIINTKDYDNFIIPTNLLIPFNIKDIDFSKGEVNPLGVVRFSKDQSDIGHPGIDIPLKQGSSLFAVGDGPIVIIDSAGDPWNGMKVFQLLEKTGEGSGWAYIYEHIKLAEGLTIGTKLKSGDLVGTKIAPDGFTVHLQLSKVFNNFKYTSDATCWPDFLSLSEKKILDDWWESYKNTKHLINSWSTTSEEGKYPFKGLLDKTKYPNGPQLCYSLGTDVR